MVSEDLHDALVDDKRRRFTLACGYFASALHERVPTLKELELICQEHNRVNVPRVES